MCQVGFIENSLVCAKFTIVDSQGCAHKDKSSVLNNSLKINSLSLTQCCFTYLWVRLVVTVFPANFHSNQHSVAMETGNRRHLSANQRSVNAIV